METGWGNWDQRIDVENGEEDDGMCHTCHDATVHGETSGYFDI